MGRETPQEAALLSRRLGAPRSLVGLWAPSTFYLSPQRMLEDKRNIWTSELIYIFGRATFPFLKRGERAPYPALGGRTAASFDAPGSSSVRRRRARRPAEIAALPDIYLFGGKGRQRRVRRLSQSTEENPATGLGPPARFRENSPAANRLPRSISGVWGQPRSLRVLVGVSVASLCACPVPSWSDLSGLCGVSRVSPSGEPPCSHLLGGRKEGAEKTQKGGGGVCM